MLSKLLPHTPSLPCLLISITLNVAPLTRDRLFTSMCTVPCLKVTNNPLSILVGNTNSSFVLTTLNELTSLSSSFTPLVYVTSNSSLFR
ncbi:hypothetical protein [Bacillus phage Tomato]|nr:hypothetical protein [Bacillus phage Tomato]